MAAALEPGPWTGGPPGVEVDEVDDEVEVDEVDLRLQCR